MPSAIDYGVDDVKAVVEDIFHLEVTERGPELDMLCPDPKHVDSRPSCAVNVGTGYWNCFSCGAGGDLVALGALVLGLPRPEVERMLKPRTPDAMMSALRRKLARAATNAKPPKGKRKVDLPDHPDRLRKRQATPLLERWFTPATFERWDLRWVDKVTLLGNKGEFTLESVIAMPVKNAKGKIEAWCYMATPDSLSWQPKYLYTPGVELSELWYGVDLHGSARDIAIVEGGLDTQWIDQCGYPALGLLGSRMGDIKVRWLGQYNSVTLLPDRDAAGLIWSRRVGDALCTRMPVYIGQYSPWMMKKRLEKDGTRLRASDPEDLFPVDVEVMMARRVPYLRWRKELDQVHPT